MDEIEIERAEYNAFQEKLNTLSKEELHQLMQERMEADKWGMGACLHPRRPSRKRNRRHARRARQSVLSQKLKKFRQEIQAEKEQDPEAFVLKYHGALSK